MTAPALPRPALTVRPMAPATEREYVLATAADALIETHGGRFCRKEVFRELVAELVGESLVEVALLDNTHDVDDDTIFGFAVWDWDPLAGRRDSLELLYLRKSLSVMRDGRREPLPLAHEVARALLGLPGLLRMRRMPPQGWAWRVVNACGYVPSICPRAL